MTRVVVLGSLNIDLVIRVPHLPSPGETVTGHSFFQAPGGKGANQAVAAAKLGANVHMVGRVGGDAFGVALRESLRAAGADDSCVISTPDVSTGVALIFVDDEGENVIVLDSAANARLSTQDVEAASSQISEADALLLQLEVPLETVLRAAQAARNGTAHLILNAAPARELPGELFPLVDTLVVNREELAALSGSRAEPREAAGALLAKGCGAVLVTLGAEGSVLVREGEATHVPAFRVEAVDTTAAGDTFAAAYAVASLEGADPETRLRFANAAAALTVTRAGAQIGMPARAEVEAFLQARPLEAGRL
ncbi:MAG: ribokinase [Chloroflexia bacterium]